MTQPGGFEIDVGRAHTAATVSLPGVAIHLAQQATQLKLHEGLQGTGGNTAAVGHLQNTYAGYTDMLAARLAGAVEIIEATGQALEEIVTLYRRADGQGE